MTPNPYGENRKLVCDCCKERPATIFKEIGRLWFYLCIECSTEKDLTTDGKYVIIKQVKKESK
jgi:hypothetical protein